MKREKTSSHFFLFLLLITLTSSLMRLVEAKKSHSQRKIPPAQVPHNGGYPNDSTIFDISSLGAKGNGVSDDSKMQYEKQALQTAWKAACKVSGATVKIPSELKFLVKPITLQGPCMPHLTLQIDGTLLAPQKGGSWMKSSLFQWINFKWVQNFTIQGSGIVDGQGSKWWGSSKLDRSQKKKYKIPGNMKPTALRFYGGSNVTVRDITIVNSPQCHLKFDNSKGVKISNITISSPESSMNTDGIHLQNTQDVEIQHSNIASGDDCVSIQTGCTNIFLHHLNCGPGHGISIGGLGQDRTLACVSNIIVDNIFMNNTLYGARIKTWQGGLGSVKNVSFSNIQVSDVNIPIMIDQYYCDKHVCENHIQAVAISGVKFEQIIGTFSSQPIYIACSRTVPCTDVDLTAVQLEPSPRFNYFHEALCWNSYGKTQGSLAPTSMDYCLRMENDALKKISKSHEKTCWL